MHSRAFFTEKHRCLSHARYQSTRHNSESKLNERSPITIFMVHKILCHELIKTSKSNMILKSKVGLTRGRTEFIFKFNNFSSGKSRNFYTFKLEYEVNQKMEQPKEGIHKIFEVFIR